MSLLRFGTLLEVVSMDEQVNEMDVAAQQAQEELKANFETWTAKDVMAWWSRNFLKAGHKRLGRILVSLTKELKAVSQSPA